MILATCATIGALLAQANDGETFRLTGRCSNIAISRTFPKRVTVDASGARIAGVSMKRAGNITWRGGTIVAPGGGLGQLTLGYGLLVRQSANIRVEKVTFTEARNGMVIDKSRGVTVTDSVFDGVFVDGIVVASSQGLVITDNKFRNTVNKPSECVIDGQKSFYVPKRVCEKKNGVYKDGYHADAVQMFNGVEDVLIARNHIRGKTQGIDNFGRKSDPPTRNIRIEYNDVATDSAHQITINRCVDCTIRFNTVARGGRWKAVIRPGAAHACGNRVADSDVGTEPCGS